MSRKCDSDYTDSMVLTEQEEHATILFLKEAWRDYLGTYKKLIIYNKPTTTNASISLVVTPNQLIYFKKTSTHSTEIECHFEKNILHINKSSFTRLQREDFIESLTKLFEMIKNGTATVKVSEED